MPHDDRHPITGCRVSTLFGHWWIEDTVLESLKNQALGFDINAIALQFQVEQAKLEEPPKEGTTPAPKKLYQVEKDHAVITLSGAYTKYGSSFDGIMGGSSLMRMTKALRAAVADDAVKVIELHFDGAPGGTVDGSYDFAEEIRKADDVKPVIATGSDKMASGAYLFAAQCRKIYANTNCEIGSIGTNAYLYDTSKKYEAAGIKVISLAQGKMKGIGTPGLEITEEQIRHLKQRISDMNDLFVKSVAERRNLTQKSVRELEAGVFIANRALKLGLIDEIARYDEVLEKPVPDKRGTKQVVVTPATPSGADPVRSKAMPLSAQQLEVARKLPGGTTITEENADTVLLDIATQQTTKVSELSRQIPTKVNEQIATRTGKLFVKQLDLSQREGKILPEQLDILKKAVMDGDKAKLEAFASDGSVVISEETLVQVLDINKPNGVTKELSGAQPAPKHEPGKDNAADDPSKVSDDRKASLLGLVGIKPGAPAAR